MAPTRPSPGLPTVQGIQAQVHGGGCPPKCETARIAPTGEAGPSQGPLFVESEPEEESASDASENSPAGLAELEGAIRAQTKAIQDQLATQEWLAGKLERVAVKLERAAVALDGHRSAMEELLAALTSVGRRFEAGLDSGVDARSEALLRAEWGGVRVTQEEVSEEES